MAAKNLWGLVLLVVFLSSSGSAGCAKRPEVILIPPCPTPNLETIRSLREDEIPDAILEYLIDIDMYCSAIDYVRE